MKCPICETESWENIDELRDKPKHDDKAVGMSICKGCGFVGYPEKYKSKEEILEYYRKDYRGGAPGYGNLNTGERKLHYHEKFLRPTFDKWISEKKTAPKIGEVGGAIGMVGNWFKMNFKDCDYHGTELTTTFRRVAFHEFGITLKEMPQDHDSFDLLMSYKVHEHLCDPDEELRMYHKLLKDDGLLYISVPTWFNYMENFGLAGFDLEYYYHPDHINVWTKKLFESLLKKCGFEIVEYDGFMYGDTYLCKKTTPVELTTADYENVDDIIEKMKKIKHTFELTKLGKFDEAVKVWPEYPIGWANAYELERADLHNKHEGKGPAIIEDFIGRMEKALGDHAEVYRLKADLMLRYGMFQDAALVLEQALEKKPNQAGFLMPMSHCFRELARATQDPDQKLHFQLTARDICRRIIQVDKQHMAEAYNWSLRDSSEIDVAHFVKFYNNQLANSNNQNLGGNNGKSV